MSDAISQIGMGAGRMPEDEYAVRPGHARKPIGWIKPDSGGYVDNI